MIKTSDLKHPLWKSTEPLWQEMSTHPDRQFLELVLLRDLAHQLHREKTLNRTQSTAELELWLEQNLAQAKSRQTTTFCPAEWKTALERPDRKWELALASAAHALGWQFGVLTGWITVSSAHSFHDQWTKQKWTTQCVLYVESGPDLLRAPQGLWQGRWHMVHRADQPPTLQVFWGLEGYSSTPDPASWHAIGRL